MGDALETESKPAFNISFDLNKWLPYLLIIGGWLIMYGRNDKSGDVLHQQVEADRAVIQSLSEKISTVSDRLARVEATLESMNRDAQQDRAYRSGVK